MKKNYLEKFGNSDDIRWEVSFINFYDRENVILISIVESKDRYGIVIFFFRKLREFLKIYKKNVL